ncbi:MAG: mitochondrial inner membrane protein required for protein import [Bogoriella megaspora]|nr:MAG: mitochondrial inner membrane protein required for protein import [Bogoriella megaspora]
MLSITAARVLARRTTPSTLRTVPTPLLSRGYAKDNNRRLDPGRATGSGSAPLNRRIAPSARKSVNEAAQEDKSKATPEFNEKATPSKNTEPASQPSTKDQTWRPSNQIKFAGAGTQAASATRAASNSKKQDARSKSTAEYDKWATPRRNTEPSGQPGPGSASAQQASSETSEAASQDEVETEKQPIQSLPDLRQGLPSTFEAEFLKKAQKEEDQEPRQLDVTEDKEHADPSSTGDRGSGGRELPKSAYESSVDRRRDFIAYYAYLMIAVFGLTGAAYFGRNWSSEEEERAHPDAPSGWSPTLMWKRIRARWGGQIGYYTEPAFQKLLPDMDPNMRPPMTLVLSLEDLLIHSEWSREHGWRMAKRPGLDYFLRYLSQYYELAIFTTVPSQTGIPVIQKLDPFHVVMWPLFREATRYENGEYIKDLTYLNRDLSKTIIIDTDPTHIKKQPENAIILRPWKGSLNDHELVSYIPFLEYVATMNITDVRAALKSFEGKHIPSEFARRESAAREEFNKRLADDRAKRPKYSGVGSLGRALGIKAEPAPGGLMIGENETVAQGLEQGKMLSDQIRERGQREYERMEKEIRDNGEKWLKEMAAEEKKAQEEQMKSMRKGAMSWFGMGGGGGKEGSTGEGTK